MNPGYVAKALVAALIAFGSSLLAVTANGGGISLHDWIAAAVAAVVAFGGVFVVPNAGTWKTPPK